MDSKIDLNCPNYESCTVRDDCAKERCCMDAEYWAKYWKARAVIRPKIDIPVRRNFNLILPEDRLICCYCEKEIIYHTDLTVEHLVPKSQGGNNLFINKRPCCYRCNGARSSQSLIMWIEKMLKQLEGARGSMQEEILIKRIKNAKFWIHYIESAGMKLYRNEELYKNRRPLT